MKIRLPATLDPADVRAVQVGTGILSFTNALQGQFIYTIDGVQRTRALRRQPIE